MSIKSISCDVSGNAQSAGVLGQRATSAMAEGRWLEAAQFWAALRTLAALSLEQCHACARVYERLQWWESHKTLLDTATTRFPRDASLRLRQTYRETIFCVETGDLDGARLLFDEVYAGSFEAWPPALNFLRWELKIGLAVMPIATAAERLAWLETGLLFKAGEVYPQRIAGFRWVVTEMSWDDPVKSGFLSSVGALVNVIRAHDTPVRLIKDEELLQVVKAVAGFWVLHGEKMLGLPCAYLEFFARLFISFGYISLYQAARAKLAERLPLQIPLPREPLHFAYALSWANEEQSEENYIKLLRAIGKEDGLPLIKQCVDLSALYHAGEVGMPSPSAKDVDFRNYVQGRSVAIVGPVDVGLKNGKEIDSFDVVIRFNHRLGLEYNPEVFGCKTNVSYYQRTILEKYSERVLSGVFSQLDFAVVDAYSLGRYRWLYDVGCQVRERLSVWYYQENPMLLGNPYAIPRVIFDILRFGPARLKVFSANLYTSMSYVRGYCEYGSMVEPNFDIFKTWGVHDPLSNFLMMKHFLARGRMECDGVLSLLLSLGPDEYMDQLRQRYGEAKVELDINRGNPDALG